MCCKLSEKTFVILFIAFVACYHLVVGLQGFDMYDEGWSLTGYQQIFNAPESIQYLFLYYLTNIVGGLWNLLFGQGGIYAFRILTGVVISLTAFIVWRMLCNYVDRWCIVLGFILALFSCYYGIMVFYHNYLTALMATGTAAILFKALVESSLPKIFLAGILLAFTVFVRLPNISLTAFALLLIPHYLYHRQAKLSLRLLGTAMGGFVAGVLLVFTVMMALGHFDIFFSALSDGASAASAPDSTHQLSAMLGQYLSIYLTIITTGIFNNVYTLYLVGTLACLWVFTARRNQEPMVYLAGISLILMHILPLGSDFGIQNMGENCLYMAAPFTVGIIRKELRNRLHGRRLRRTLQGGALFIALLLIARGGKNIMQQCYFDEGSRMEKTYTPDTPLATTFTTQRNSEELNAIMQALSPYVKPDDYLLCFQNMPMLHFLTQTRPYLKNPWVWSYDTSNMERQFRQAEDEHQTLPVIVRDKSMIPYWTVYYPNWDNTHAPQSYLHKNGKIILIRQFISKHRYHVVWEDDVCQILIPS